MKGLGAATRQASPVRGVARGSARLWPFLAAVCAFIVDIAPMQVREESRASAKQVSSQISPSEMSGFLKNARIATNHPKSGMNELSGAVARSTGDGCF